MSLFWIGLVFSMQITVKGSMSYDPYKRGPLRYQWNFLKKPALSTLPDSALCNGGSGESSPLHASVVAVVAWLRAWAAVAPVRCMLVPLGFFLGL